MPLVINSFNIGQDISVTIQAEDGTLIPVEAFGHLMDFEANSDDTMLKIVPINNGGVPIYNTIWQGMSGKMTFTRYNGFMTNVMAALMNDFYNRGSMPHWTIFVSVLNRDGSVDQYIFSGVAWTKSTFGNFKADKEVDNVLNFQAQTMTSTASGVGSTAGSSFMQAASALGGI